MEHEQRRHEQHLTRSQRVPVHVYFLIIILVVGSAWGVALYNEQAAQSLVANPATAQKIARSEAFGKVLNQRLEQALNASNSDLDIEGLLTNSAILQSLVDNNVARQLDQFSRSDAFKNAITEALPVNPATDDNASLLQQIQRKMQQYESRLTDVSQRVNDDESAQAVNALQSNFVELQHMLGDLSAELRCSLAMSAEGKSSFLLKEKRSTNLRVYNVVVTLGSIRKDMIDSVTISGPSADNSQTDTRVVGNVRLGSSLEFQSGGHNYEGLFTFKQARFGPDFVGFEVREKLLPGEGCASPT